MGLTISNPNLEVVAVGQVSITAPFNSINFSYDGFKPGDRVIVTKANAADWFEYWGDINQISGLVGIFQEHASIVKANYTYVVVRKKP